MGVFARKTKRGPVFWISFMFRGRQVFERSGRDKRAAEQLFRQRKREIAEGRYQDGKTATGGTLVRTYAQRWLDGRQVRDNSLRNERWGMRYILDSIGDLRMDDLSPATIDNLVKDVKRLDLAPRSKRSILRTARTMLNAAVRSEVLAADPWNIPSKVLPKAKSLSPRGAYSEGAVRKLCTTPGYPKGAMAAWLAFYTGARTGEIAGWRIEDWDISRGPLTSLLITRQYDGQPTKTDEVLTVPVHPQLEPVLAWWIREQLPELLGRPAVPTDPLIPNRSGGHIRSQSSFYNIFARQCDRARVDMRTVHATRNTFCTQLRKCGARGEIVDILTHSTKGRKAVDGYVDWQWPTICSELALLSYEHDARHGFGPNYGSLLDVQGHAPWEDGESGPVSSDALPSVASSSATLVARNQRKTRGKSHARHAASHAEPSEYERAVTRHEETLEAIADMLEDADG